MRFVQDEIDLSTRFSVQCAALLPGMPLDYGGMKTERAPSGTYKDMMVRFRVSRLSAGSRIIGTEGAIKHYRNYGSVLMQTIGPIGSGTGRVMEVVDILSGIFAVWRQGGMLCMAPSAGPLIEEKSDISVTVSVPFTSDFRI